MYVFLSSEAAIEIGRQINWGQTLYLCLTYARPILMEIKKESRRWRHYPQATSISNNILWKWWKENSETFWNLWNEAWSSGLKERYMLKPAGLMLDEKGSNLNAIKYAFGSKFMKRCISSDFHFKQSENQKMKDSNMFKRNMLEA